MYAHYRHEATAPGHVTAKKQNSSKTTEDVHPQLVIKIMRWKKRGGARVRCCTPRHPQMSTATPSAGGPATVQYCNNTTAAPCIRTGAYPRTPGFACRHLTSNPCYSPATPRWCTVYPHGTPKKPPSTTMPGPCSVDSMTHWSHMPSSRRVSHTHPTVDWLPSSRTAPHLDRSPFTAGAWGDAGHHSSSPRRGETRGILHHQLVRLDRLTQLPLPGSRPISPAPPDGARAFLWSSTLLPPVQ